jgi:hypothetical protein
MALAERRQDVIALFGRTVDRDRTVEHDKGGIAALAFAEHVLAFVDLHAFRFIDAAGGD